jgi:hypothetical protein
MNRTQKGAWYGVLLSLLLVGIVVLDLLDTAPWPVKLPVALLWGGFLLGPLFLIGRKRGRHEVPVDERDRRIVKKALLASFCVLAGILGLVYVGLFLALDLRDRLWLDLDQISAAVYFALVVFILAMSLAVLVQYRGEGKEDMTTANRKVAAEGQGAEG